jgi:predicted permease
MPALSQDLLHALRGLRKRPGFLSAAVVTLAVGIGANVTVFSLVNALLLRPLPFGDRSDRVVMLHSTHAQQTGDWDDARISYLDFVDFREHSRSFERVGVFLHRNFTVTNAAEAERVLGVSVTPDLFAGLGIHPVLGRHFIDDDGAAPGLESVVILSHGLWQRRFGGDPAIVGRAVVINDRTRTVIGVMPPGFKFPERSELFMPLRLSEAPRSQRGFTAIGILTPGTTIEQAQADVSGIARRLEADYPATNRGFGIRVVSFRDSFVGADDRALSLTLMAAVAFVLLIACANLANLLLVRGAARQREMAVRAAMGAGRVRLMMVVLSESAVLSALGSGLGMLAAAWCLDVMRASWPEEIPYWVQFTLDARVVAFTIGLTALTAFAIGLLPALRAARPHVVADLKDGGRGLSLGRTGQRLQTSLAVAQVALCLALLVGANLMIRSFLSLQHADIGFDPASLLTLRVYLSGDQYDDPRSRAAFFDRTLGTIAAVPEVASAVATTSIPGDDGGAAMRLVTDARSAPDAALGSQAIATTPHLFDTLGLTMVQGRTFTASEAADPGARVTILNERLASRLFPGESPLDQRVGMIAGDETLWVRVVGVAPNVVYEEVGEETEQSRLNLYLPYAFNAPRSMAVIVRATGDPDALRGPVRDALRRTHAGLPVYDIRTMDEVRRSTTFEQRLFGSMMGVFAGAALLLACLGVYALLAYAARLRTREIGVRLSLGADPRQVAGLFLRQAASIGAAGLTIGLALAWMLARSLAGLLYAVDALDPVPFAGIALTLLVVVLVSAGLPARQAARVDPMTALRSE